MLFVYTYKHVRINLSIFTLTCRSVTCTLLLLCGIDYYKFSYLLFLYQKSDLCFAYMDVVILVCQIFRNKSPLHQQVMSVNVSMDMIGRASTQQTQSYKIQTFIHFFLRRFHIFFSFLFQSFFLYFFTILDTIVLFLYQTTVEQEVTVLFWPRSQRYQKLLVVPPPALIYPQQVSILYEACEPQRTLPHIRKIWLLAVLLIREKKIISFYNLLYIIETRNSLFPIPFLMDRQTVRRKNKWTFRIMEQCRY